MSTSSPRPWFALSAPLVLVLLAGTAQGDRPPRPAVVAVTGSLHAMTDLVTDTSLCTAQGGEYVPAATDYAYSLRSSYVGTFEGTGRGCGHSTGKVLPDGSTPFVETNTFVGTVKGCGTGTVVYDVHGFIYVIPDPAVHGVPAQEDWKVVSSTLSPSRLLSGKGHDHAVINPDSSIDADFTGSVTCPVPPRQPHVLRVNAPYSDPTPSDFDGAQCRGLAGPAKDPDCRVSFVGTSEWKGGTIIGRERYELSGGVTPDGRLHYEGPAYITGSVVGCGTGTFIIDNYGGYVDFARTDLQNNLPGGVGGSAPGFNYWRIRPGSGTGGLTGLVSGNGVNHWRFYLQGTAGAGGPEGVGRFTGTVRCTP